MWRLLSILALFSLPALALAQGRIEGTVVDARTREPLIGVNVIIVDSDRGVATGADGRFVLTGLAPGSYILRFSYIGYETVVKTDVVVSTARPEVLTVAMAQSALLQQEIVVTAGYFTEQVQTPVSIAQLSREEIRRFPGGFEDIVRAVATLPGVAVVNEGGRNDLLVRGGGPSENLYVLNNIEIPNINHFGNQGSSSGALSFINLDFIESVEFSAGGFSAAYGDKLSSTLSLNTRPARRDALGGKATISATQFGLNLEGPLTTSGDFLFSARQSYLDLIFRAAGQPFIPVYTDFNAFVHQSLAPNTELSLFGLAALDRVDRDQSSLENRVTNAGIMDNSQDQFIFGANVQRLLRNGFVNFSVNSNINRFRFSQADEAQVDYFRSQADEIELAAKVSSYLQLGATTGLTSGISAKQIISDNQTSFADTVFDRSGERVPIAALGLPRSAVLDTAAWKAAGYVEIEQKLWRQHTLRAGLRADYYGFIEKKWYPSARLLLAIKAAERVTVKASAGRYFQSPAYVWVVNPANQALRALRNDAGIAGIDVQARDDVNVRLEAYYKRYRHLPTGVIPGVTDYYVLTNTGVGFGGREDDFQSFGYNTLVSTGKGHAYGLELLVQKKFSRLPFYGQFSLSLGKSEFTAGNGQSYPGQFDQRLVLNLSGGYKPGTKWEYASKIRYFTGSPYTPVYVPASNGGRLQNLPEEYLAARLSPGFLWDVRVDRRFNFSAWSLIAFVDIQNVLNTKVQRRPDYDFWEMTIEDRNPIGILPSIGISAEFTL